MKITQVVRDYAQSHRIEDVETAVDEGMKEKSAELLKEGGQIYREVWASRVLKASGNRLRDNPGGGSGPNAAIHVRIPLWGRPTDL